MLEGIFQTIFAESISLTAFLAAAGVSLILGFLISLCYRREAGASASMSGSLALLPFLVSIVILLVNGNLGAGVAVAGAFSLIRFRSAPGTARDITIIFLTMTVGLACGMGYIAIAIFCAAVTCLLFLFYGSLHSHKGDCGRELKITIPENLDYSGLFDDLFADYTSEHELLTVKTANLGSLYHLCYRIRLKETEKEKEFIDKLRCRNGNLDIVCGRIPTGREGL